ncbi:hypothetical protein DFH27DRAFT_616925 [Peziza echinospora]|nr:hypothetical protein DFH27DRAFT_616925 [Peziza echinospora]
MDMNQQSSPNATIGSTSNNVAISKVISTVRFTGIHSYFHHRIALASHPYFHDRYNPESTLIFTTELPPESTAISTTESHPESTAIPTIKPSVQDSTTTSVGSW